MVSPLFLWNSNHLLFYHIRSFLSGDTSCHLSHLKKGSGKELKLITLKRFPEPFQSSHLARLQQSGRLLKVADKENFVSLIRSSLEIEKRTILRKLASQVLSATSKQCFEQSTTASCCYSYQTSKTGQFLSSLFSTIKILSSRLQTVYSYRPLRSLMVSKSPSESFSEHKSW